MSVINTNITSMIGQSNLSKSQNALQTSMERLSSGLRINSAKDDAAGQAIANRMTAQITGLAQAQRNANDGISVAQTAEGALNQVNDNLQRIRELSVQAQNGTNSEQDLESIQAEIGQRLNEINRISEETDFNGTKVLSENQSINIQVGANDGEVISVNLEKITSGTLGLDSLDVTNMAKHITSAAGLTVTTAGTPAVSGLDTTTLNPTSADGFDDGTETSAASGSSFAFTDTNGGSTAGMSVVDDGAGAYYVTDGTNYYATTSEDVASAGDTTVSITYDSSTAVTLESPAVPAGTTTASSSATFAFEDSSNAALTGEFSVLKAKDDTFYIKDEQGDFYEATATVSGDGNTVTLTRTTDTALTAAEASAAGLNTLGDLDNALNQVDTLRSDLGAIQNRFESAITNLQTNETNLSAARSRIEDADYAVEVANMTRAQILQQAGTSVLAQANQIPQNVLSLLG